MNILFLLLSNLGLAYFLLIKRRFDWFAVAFFSAMIYFLPGFLGYTSYLSQVEWVETPINARAYVVMILVEAAIIIGAIMNDLFPEKARVSYLDSSKQSNIPTLPIILMLAIGGCTLLVLTAGTTLWGEEKQILMADLNRAHILFYTATIIGMTISFERRRWKYFSAFCIFAVFDLFIGFRLPLAISGISILTLWLSKKGRIRLLTDSWKPLLAVGLLGIFLFFYKEIGFAIRMGDWDLFRSILSEPNTYLAMFITSEPFVIQSILNEVTMLDFSVGWRHLLGIFSQFILFSPELGWEEHSFNDLFQMALFPEVTYGMANNIWAEMWSIGGWLFLLVFIFLFVAFLKIFSFLLTFCDPSLRSFFAVMASYWAFYIHRNDIGYEIALQKRVVILMVLVFLFAILMRNLKRVMAP
jgi:hypothetical protein